MHNEVWGCAETLPGIALYNYLVVLSIRVLYFV